MQNENKRRPAAFRKVAAVFGIGKGRRASQVQKHDDDSSDTSYVEHAKNKKKHHKAKESLEGQEAEEEKEEDLKGKQSNKNGKKNKKKNEFRRNSMVTPRGEDGKKKAKKGGKNDDPTDSFDDETGSHGDEEEGNENNEYAKAKKKRDEEYKQSQIDAIINKEKEVIEEFSKYTNKRKLIQAFFIIMMLTIMASYFLIKYLLSLYLYDKMQSSVADLEIIFGRLACSQNVLNTYVESYFSTDLIQSQNLDFLSLNGRIDSCMETERNSEIRLNTSKQLKGACCAMDLQTLACLMISAFPLASKYASRAWQLTTSTQ
ncbi:hypothetical protein FGO68_gene17347 [Halteria grandinella]|uniref:Uncharacterized protein n=1 Tax=Halteria grandinella TaxID=5974 RepID=A0A8J8P5S7_HALGN|nr:hypothetical protein FGO68_gene17347 [Halteria grandinella]